MSAALVVFIVGVVAIVGAAVLLIVRPGWKNGNTVQANVVPFAARQAHAPPNKSSEYGRQLHTSRATQEGLQIGRAQLHITDIRTIGIEVATVHPLPARHDGASHSGVKQHRGVQCPPR